MGQMPLSPPEAMMGNREQLLGDLGKHEREISALSLSLQSMPAELTRHIAFLHGQVMRHRISVALIESRLPGASPIGIASSSST